MATLRWATCFPSKREPNSHISLAQATNGPSHAFSHALPVPLTEEQGSRRNMSSLSGFLSSRPSDLVLKAHGMRNEMYYILSEMALDRSSLHPWFLHRSGTSTISPASKRCDQDGLCSRFTLHSLLAVISLRIPWARGSPLQSECSRGRPSWSPCQLATISHAPRSIRKGAPVWRSSYHET